MKKIMTGLLMGVLVLMGGFGLNNHQVQAADNGAEKTDYEVIPVKPTTQVDLKKNYFDLEVKPGDTETLEMKVINYADHEITVYSNLRSAYTQLGGGIEFGIKLKKSDPDVNPDFDTIANLPKKYSKIVLPAHKAKLIHATVTMPEDKQRGMIYGDWHFVEHAQNADKTTTGSAGASSDYSYSVGVAMRGSHYKVYPELKYQSVTPILSNGIASMSVNLRNTQPMVLNHVTAKVAITKQGIFSSKHVKAVTDQEVAPNSVFSIPVSWDMEQLKPGKYMVEASVQGNNLWNKLPVTWKFKKSFTVKNQQIKKINTAALKKPTNKWAYIATAAGVMTLISGAALVKLIKVN